jgi:hypothetical protein
MADADEAAQDGVPDRIGFDYIKSNHFRVIAVNGVYGGISPRGQLSLAFWNERKPIAQHVAHTLTKDPGSNRFVLGEELTEERVTRSAFVREVEICALVDMDTAKSIATWILSKVREYEEALDTSKGDAAQNST